MKRLIPGITIAVLALWILVLNLHGQECGQKISPDLHARILRGDPAESIDVIVQLNPNHLQDLKRVLSTCGATIRNSFESIDGLTVSIPIKLLPRIGRLQGIRYITPDRNLQPMNHITREAVGFDVIHGSQNKGEDDEGEDEGEDDEKGKGKGKGICMAIIDSGLNGKKDIGTRVARSIDLVNWWERGRDGHGHGTHVGGIIAGNGSQAQADDYSIFPEGGAPEGIIYNYRVLDENGTGSVSAVITAIDWIMQHNARNRIDRRIRVVNLSLGHPVFESYHLDPLCQALERAVLSGIAVVCAAGNYGYSDGKPVYGGIVSPGNHPLAITVGAVNTMSTVKRSDDLIAQFSSRGPTLIDGVMKPDIVAPGNSVLSLLPHDSTIEEEHPDVIVDPQEFDANKHTFPEYMRLSGTSMAAPVVTGTIGLMLETNASLTPNLVKIILMYTAQKMIEPDIFTQGAGYLNAEGAVRLASSLRGEIDRLRPGDHLLVEEVEPYTRICGEKVIWGSGIFWGDRAVWSDGICWGDGDLWGNGILWDQGIFWSDKEAWNEPLFKYYQEAYGQGIFWGDIGGFWTGDTGPKTENVVFGNGIFWGDSIVDPNSCGSSNTWEVLYTGDECDVSGLTVIDEMSTYYPVQR
jgi:serine protease AprX